MTPALTMGRGCGPLRVPAPYPPDQLYRNEAHAGGGGGLQTSDEGLQYDIIGRGRALHPSASGAAESVGDGEGLT